MVVRIRLARWGQTHRPFYRIVAADARAKRDGRFLQVLGTYNPRPHSRREAAAHVKRVCLHVDRIKYWLAVGAQPSDTVARLLGAAGLLPFAPAVVARRAQPPSPSPSPSPSPPAGAAVRRAFGSVASPAGLRHLVE